MGLPSWDTIEKLLKEFGWVKGTFTGFFWVAHYWIFRLYNGRLKDRQTQIDELAKENHEYRDRFLALLDDHYGFEKHETPELTLQKERKKPDKGKRKR